MKDGVNLFKKEDQKYNLISYTNEEELTLKEVLLDKLNISVRSISKMKREQSVFVNGVFKNGITYYIKEKNENVKVRFVNRLDMNNSGLVIVAKNAYAHHTLSVDMGNDAVEKKYITVVKGIVENDEGTINEPIYRPTEDSIKRIVDEKGQASITHYKVLERLNDATVVEVKLETGRTHQIRVHMSHIGHGIIGDELYGYVDENLINRQALHAYSLSFNQPRTKENLEFKAELSNDIKNLIEKLRKNN